MPEKTWREKSLEYIHEGYCEVKKEQPELTDKEVLRIVGRDYYPFGERAYFPYAAWLKAMRQYKAKRGIVSAAKGLSEMNTPLFDM